MIKARSSTGISVIEYQGGFSYKEAADFEIAGIDADKTISFQVRNDEKLKENQFAFVQFAMLYATQFGDRRIRVFNINLPVAKNLNEYYKKTDCEALAFYLLRKELSRSFIRGSKPTRESLINNLVTLLFNYRTHCATTSSPS